MKNKFTEEISWIDEKELEAGNKEVKKYKIDAKTEKTEDLVECHESGVPKEAD